MALKLKTIYNGYEAEYYVILQLLSDKSSAKTGVVLALYKDEATCKIIDKHNRRIGLTYFLLKKTHMVDGNGLTFQQAYEALKLPKIINGVNTNPLTEAEDC